MKSFFARFRNTDGSLVGGINEYAAPDDAFKALLRQHLEELFHRRLPAAPARGKPRQIEATIPGAYLDWLRVEYADVSLLGQERQQGQALTLSHVYVPALTAPPAEPDVPPTGNRRRKREDAAGRNGGTKTDPAAAAARCGVALRSSPRRRRQIDLLPLGGAAEHRCRRPRARRPGAGGIRRDGADEPARPAAAAGAAARLPRGHRLRPRPPHPLSTGAGGDAGSVGGPVAGRPTDRREPPCPSAGRDRLPAAGRPRRSAGLGHPRRRHGLSARPAADRPRRCAARMAEGRQPGAVDQPPLRPR